MFNETEGLAANEFDRKLEENGAECSEVEPAEPEEGSRDPSLRSILRPPVVPVRPLHAGAVRPRVSERAQCAAIAILAGLDQRLARREGSR